MQHYQKITTGLALLPLVLSLTSCQAPPTAQPAPEASPTEAASLCTYTGIQTDITEHDASYPHYAALKTYLDEKQFALLRLAHIGEPHIFEGCETQDWQWEDWELVLQYLNNPSASDQGYGKADFDNDGTAELIHRTVYDNRQIAVTVYQLDEKSEQIAGTYSLAKLLADTALQDYALQQLWFQQFGTDIVTFRLFRKEGTEAFVLLSDRITLSGGHITCSRLETRALTVMTEPSENMAQTIDADIFCCRILDLTAGNEEASLTLGVEQLDTFQKTRSFTPSSKTLALPKELLAGITDTLKDAQRYSHAWDTPEDIGILAEYADTAHQLGFAQVRAYLDSAFPDCYDSSNLSAAYLTDLNQDGCEELVLSCVQNELYPYVDIWQKQADGTARQLYHITDVFESAALLYYQGTPYYMTRHREYYTLAPAAITLYCAGADGTLTRYDTAVYDVDTTRRWTQTYRSPALDASLEQQLCAYIEGIQREIEEKTVFSEYELIDGSAEVPCKESDAAFLQDAFPVEYYYGQVCNVVDFDNDGALEYVKKQACWPADERKTALYMTHYFYKKYDSHMRELNVLFPGMGSPDPASSGEVVDQLPVQLWFETFDQKVYTFYLTRIAHSSDYFLQVSLIEGEHLQPLLQYLLIADKYFSCEEGAEDMSTLEK